jgi:hypothetical protein
MVGLLAGGLLAAMLPGLAMADQPSQLPLNPGRCIATPGTPGVDDTWKIDRAADLGPRVIVFAPSGARYLVPWGTDYCVRIAPGNGLRD